MNVGQICTSEIVTATAEELVVAIARRLRDEHVGDVIVVGPSPAGDAEGDPDAESLFPVGVLTDRDIMIHAVADAPDRIATLTVGEVMTRAPACVSEASSVSEALRLMRKVGSGRLPVTNARGELVGVFTREDALAFLSEEMGHLVKIHERRVGS